MQTLSPLQYAFIFAQPVLQSLILWAMLRDRVREKYTFFFTYTVFQILSVLTLMAVFHFADYRSYFYAYWTASAVSMLLGLAIVSEVFKHLFEPFAMLREMGKQLFHWALIILVLTAVLVSVGSAATGGDRVGVAILAAERGLRTIQAGLLLLVILLAKNLGLSWRDRNFGIVLGFAVFAMVELGVVAAIARLGDGAAPALSMVKSFAYLVSLGIWTKYFLSPVPVTTHTPAAAPAEEWDFAIGQTKYDHSVGFVGAMERTVDRLLERRSTEL